MRDTTTTTTTTMEAPDHPQCAVLLGLARPVRVKCAWNERHARCTAIINGVSIPDAIARLRKLWNIADDITITGKQVSDAGGVR